MTAVTSYYEVKRMLIYNPKTIKMHSSLDDNYYHIIMEFKVNVHVYSLGNVTWPRSKIKLIADQMPSSYRTLLDG